MTASGYPDLRATILAAAQGYADEHQIWPLGEAVTNWLAGSGSTAPLPAISVHRAPGSPATGYTIWTAGGPEILAPDLATARVALAEVPSGQLVWARGRTSPVAAAARDWPCQRRLLLLQKDLAYPLPDPRWPPGYGIRAFEVGRDEPRWLAANRAAFTELPDQGNWGLAELQERLTAPWFVPEAFLLLVDRTDEIAGFVWAKVGHTPADVAHAGGEIYVIAVHPAHQGHGLGRMLTIAGLAAITHAGHTRAHLYVDQDNLAARGLYRRLGFTEHEQATALRAP